MIAASPLATIAAFHERSKENHRYRSWMHCYEAFNENADDSEHLALHLAFFLASWGMYRGSSQLLQRDYKVHLGAVEATRKFSDLRGISFEDAQMRMSDLFALKDEITRVYTSFDVTPTSTLITKVMMGTLACVPAYDRYFEMGIARHNAACSIRIPKNFSQNGFSKLLKEAIGMEGVFSEAGNIVGDGENGYVYPPMKLLDMHFWELGYNE